MSSCVDYIKDWNCWITGRDTLLQKMNSKQCQIAFQDYHTNSQCLISIAVPFLHFVDNTFIVRLLNVENLGFYFGFNIYSLIVNELEHLFRMLWNMNVVSSVKLLFVFLLICPLSFSSFSYEFIGLYICTHIHSCH